MDTPHISELIQKDVEDVNARTVKRINTSLYNVLPQLKDKTVVIYETITTKTYFGEATLVSVDDLYLFVNTGFSSKVYKAKKIKSPFGKSKWIADIEITRLADLK